MKEKHEYLIWSEEHGAWWRENASGYTRSINQAGRYTKSQADLILKEANRGRSIDAERTFNEIAIREPEMPFESLRL